MDDLHFFGIGSAFNPALKNTNAWFVYGKNSDKQLYIVDCGETSFEMLAALPAVRECADIFVVLTHLHDDHAGSVAAFTSYCAYELQKKVWVIYPETTVCDLLRLQGIHEDEYLYAPSLPAQARVRFTPFPVTHVDDMRCYGYIIATEAWRIYFSGDAATIPDEVLQEFFAGKLDKLYQDTTLKEEARHGALRMLEKTFAPEHRKRVFCMHLESGAKDIVQRAGFSIPEIFQETAHG